MKAASFVAVFVGLLLLLLRVDASEARRVPPTAKRVVDPTVTDMPDTIFFRVPEQKRPLSTQTKEDEYNNKNTTTSQTVLLIGGRVHDMTTGLDGVERDVLIAGTRIVSIVPPGTAIIVPGMSVLDVTGCIIVAGLVDVHVHAAGGGGEAGPASRTPEAKLSELINGGITTFFGITGTDSVSRSLENLLVKVKGLTADGLSGVMITGSYAMPTPTLTGSVQRDLVLIGEVVAAKVAVSDHRSRAPTADELNKLALDVRVGGMLSGKGGVMYCHVGSQATMLQPLRQILADTDVPIHQIVPTHVSGRGPALQDDAKAWVMDGGFVDFTADSTAETVNVTADLMEQWRREGNVDPSHVSISSDAYGSFSLLDDSGNIVGYGVSMPDSLLHTVRTLVNIHHWPIAAAFASAAAVPASYTHLTDRGKGFLAEGNDADILVLSDDAALDLLYVFGRGQLLKSPGWTKKGMFE